MAARPTRRAVQPRVRQEGSDPQRASWAAPSIIPHSPMVCQALNYLFLWSHMTHWRLHLRRSCRSFAWRFDMEGASPRHGTPWDQPPRREKTPVVFSSQLSGEAAWRCRPQEGPCPRSSMNGSAPPRAAAQRPLPLSCATGLLRAYETTFLPLRFCSSCRLFPIARMS